MFKLIKSEIEYFIWLYAVIALMLFTFTFFAAADQVVFESHRFFGKYFWSALIGLGCYLLVYTMGISRIKEKRDRQLVILPLSLKKIAFARLLFGTSPFLLIYLYLMIFSFLADKKWDLFATRINAQTGMLFVFLAMVALFMSLKNLWLKDPILIKSFKLISAMTASLLPIGLFISGVIMSVIPPIEFLTEEFYFYLAGFALFAVSVLAFSKQETYLN
jgi:hypothetical protein